MLIPVRCFTCNKVIGHLWTSYQEKVAQYLADGKIEMEAHGSALDEVGLKKYCCRRMLLSHVNVIDDLLQYSNNPGESSSKYTEELPEDYTELEPEPAESDDSDEEQLLDESDGEPEYNYIVPENSDSEEGENYTYIDDDDE